MTAPVLELRGVAKQFAGVRALDGVSLTIEAGEIHCLAGENGSGKSTLIKIVSGVNQPDGGQILFDGVPVTGLTPRSAIDHGVQVIYQDFSLFGNLSVAENLGIGAELRDRRRVVSHARIRGNAEAAMARLGVHLPLDDAVDTLPTAGRQLVAIARALTASPRLLIMDEPTTALTGREIETLFSVVRDIQTRGIAVLFVSHKMREMLDIAERITIIRNGRVVGTGPIADYDERGITRAMTGLDIPVEPYLWKAAAETPTPVLKIDNLGVPGELENVSFSILPGEIVGVSGLLGSGRTELALALFGMRPGYGGTIRIDGKIVALQNTMRAIGHGIAYVPEDRLTEGLFMPQTIDRNILAGSLEKLSRFGMLRVGEAAREAARMIREMAIATPTGNRPVMQLSGGNQQRVVIARWLLRNPRLLILNGPTVGVDVGSKAGIHRMVRDLARNAGIGVLMISDDLPELTGNCNRILLMHRGRLDGFAGGTPGDAPEIQEQALSARLKELA